MGKMLIFRLLMSFWAWQSYRLIPRFDSWKLTTITSLDSLPKSTPTELPLSIYIVYFDQSSPKLRPGVKAMLDTLARRLVDQPTLMATITGYTDDIGKRELNLILAEHRAKAVENYLRQYGVRADQIVAQWEGPDKKASADGSANVKTISRRVVIQLLPK